MCHSAGNESMDKKQQRQQQSERRQKQQQHQHLHKYLPTAARLSAAAVLRSPAPKPAPGPILIWASEMFPRTALSTSNHPSLYDQLCAHRSAPSVSVCCPNIRRGGEALRCPVLAIKVPIARAVTVQEEPLQPCPACRGVPGTVAPALEATRSKRIDMHTSATETTLILQGYGGVRCSAVLPCRRRPSSMPKPLVGWLVCLHRVGAALSRHPPRHSANQHAYRQIG